MASIRDDTPKPSSQGALPKEGCTAPSGQDMKDEGTK